MIDGGRRPQPIRRDGISTKDLGDEYLLYDRSCDRVHVLNGTAREIFLLCDGTRTLDELGDELTRQFDVDRGDLMRDLAFTVDRLVDLGLLRLD